VRKDELERIKNAVKSLEFMKLSIELGRTDRAYEEIKYIKGSLEKILKDREMEV